MIDKIVRFLKNSVKKEPFVLVALIIILPPLGIALLWTASDEDISRKDKRTTTAIASVVWIFLVVSAIAVLIPFFVKESRKNRELIVDHETEATVSAPQTTAVPDTTFETQPNSSDVPKTSESTSVSTPGTSDTVKNPDPDTEHNSVPDSTTSDTASAPETDPKNNESGSSDLVIVDCSYSVQRGNYAHITVKGRPGTEYECKVKYSSGYSSAKGLGKAMSDSNGNVTWKWRIGAKASTSFKPEISVTGDGRTVTAVITVLE